MVASSVTSMTAMISTGQESLFFVPHPTPVADDGTVEVLGTDAAGTMSFLQAAHAAEEAAAVDKMRAVTH